ncbi:hypothetical protein [Heyndrickxia acidicola]|uniref:Lipoprotein n=1 Tax=Heyndrickxia acidicola TaxID=209389 RepID=A0ABU6MLW9_9BACI|nr:hypothetical protein [Heyndrickxia acidicola]MED1204613.1 hypothetical protein [Heyndrickxia acidicola]
MRKICTSVIAAALAIGLAGCTGQNGKTNTPPPQAEGKNTKTTSTYPFPKNPVQKGKAQLILSNQNGDTSRNKAVIVDAKKTDIVDQLGTYYTNFDGRLLTFLYINQTFASTEEVTGDTQSFVNLSGDDLKPGTYTVTAVQFKDNDPTSTVINLTQAKYKVVDTK